MGGGSRPQREKCSPGFFSWYRKTWRRCDWHLFLHGVSDGRGGMLMEAPQRGKLQAQPGIYEFAIAHPAYPNKRHAGGSVLNFQCMRMDSSSHALLALRCHVTLPLTPPLQIQSLRGQGREHAAAAGQPRQWRVPHCGPASICRAALVCRDAAHQIFCELGVGVGLGGVCFVAGTVTRGGSASPHERPVRREGNGARLSWPGATHACISQTASCLARYAPRSRMPAALPPHPMPARRARPRRWPRRVRCWRGTTTLGT